MGRQRYAGVYVMSSFPIKLTDIDPETVALLPVLRHQLAALQGANPLAWQLAFSLAEQRWGEGRGLVGAPRSGVFVGVTCIAKCAATLR